MLPAYYDALEGVAEVLRALALKTPPNAGGGLRSLLAAATQGRMLEPMPLEQQRDVLDLFTKSARLSGRLFESEIKAAFGFDRIVGSYASPDTPGSAYAGCTTSRRGEQRRKLRGPRHRRHGRDH